MCDIRELACLITLSPKYQRSVMAQSCWQLTNVMLHQCSFFYVYALGRMETHFLEPSDRLKGIKMPEYLNTKLLQSSACLECQHLPRNYVTHNKTCSKSIWIPNEQP